MTVGVARAQDDDEDDKTFEEKIIDGIMAGIGATNMENRGIDYRERSPLVVPPKLDLPPPETVKSEIKDPNWPKDPDEARRKAAIAARKKDKTKDPMRSRPPADPEPNSMSAGRRRPSAPATIRSSPANSNTNPMLSPSQLGFNGGLIGLFGGNKTEAAPFKGEPTRESLTQPPAGYQTPSPNFAYGTGPKEAAERHAYRRDDGQRGFQLTVAR